MFHQEVLASLQQKGIILKEGDLYSIHYKLIPYMRLRADCDYATVIHEVRHKIITTNDYILKHQNLFQVAR